MKFKKRQFYPRLKEHIKIGDMVVLHKKGYEYEPGMVKDIKRHGRRKYIVTAQISGVAGVVKGKYHEFIKVRRDNFIEFCFRPFDKLFNRLFK